ncbi:MAG: hypothetical protein IH831_03630 [Planctomycetes bacterium]|nr:hypothetical protein [Planctomycetota bacterium]
MPQTLWVSRRCGQLANRLVLAANLIAYAEEHGCRVVNYTLHSYAKHFQRLRHDWKCVSPSQGVPLMDRLPWITDWLRETRRRQLDGKRSGCPRALSGLGPEFLADRLTFFCDFAFPAGHGSGNNSWNFTT